jgi:hypothetical protein
MDFDPIIHFFDKEVEKIYEKVDVTVTITPSFQFFDWV